MHDLVEELEFEVTFSPKAVDGLANSPEDGKHNIAVESLVVSIAADDFYSSAELGRHLPRDHEAPECLNPLLLHALQKKTNTPWRVVGRNIAVERVKPYRSVVLQGDALDRWTQLQKEPRKHLPFEMELDVFTPLAETDSGGRHAAGKHR